MTFFKFGYGICGLVTIVIVCTVNALLLMAVLYWITMWSQLDFEEQQRQYYPQGLAILTGSLVLFGVIRAIVMFTILQANSKSMHD